MRKTRAAGSNGTAAIISDAAVRTTKGQIKRHRAMLRHIAQIHYHCRFGDETCRPKQRQALLQWAYDSRKM